MNHEQMKQARLSLVEEEADAKRLAILNNDQNLEALIIAVDSLVSGGSVLPAAANKLNAAATRLKKIKRNRARVRRKIEANEAVNEVVEIESDEEE